MSAFRNMAAFDLSLVPVQVARAFQPCVWGGEDVHVLLTTTGENHLTLSRSPFDRIPMVTLWDLYNESDDLCGYLFQTSAAKVSSSASHVLIQSPALCRQFTVDDALAEGGVCRLHSTDNFNIYTYDIGATLIAQKAVGFMARVLDKEQK